MRDSLDANQYLLAFERNCPGVRMTKDEREELRRLFFVLIEALSNAEEARKRESARARASACFCD